jgi:hypothetical protein
MADLLPRVSGVLAEIEAKRPRGQVWDSRSDSGRVELALIGCVCSRQR